MLSLLRLELGLGLAFTGLRVLVALGLMRPRGLSMVIGRAFGLFNSPISCLASSSISERFVFLIGSDASMVLFLIFNRSSEFTAYSVISDCGDCKLRAISFASKSIDELR